MTRRPVDKRLSFNEVPDIYDEIRPSYPAGLYETLFEMLPPGPAIVEVGPGTGQATRDLLDRGASVHAVEIGPATADKLCSNLRGDRLRVTVGDFETVDIAPGTADAVFAATAYHWISSRAQTNRPATILRRGGVVAIVDLIQVTSPEDHGFFQAAQPIYENYGKGHDGPRSPPRAEVDPPMRDVLDTDDRYGEVVVREWSWDQTYSAADYRQLMLSYSWTQMVAPTRPKRTARGHGVVHQPGLQWSGHPAARGNAHHSTRALNRRDDAHPTLCPELPRSRRAPMCRSVLVRRVSAVGIPSARSGAPPIGTFGTTRAVRMRTTW
jgi:SAM-dependent methyltransferase